MLNRLFLCIVYYFLCVILLVLVMAVMQVQIGTHSFTFDHVYGSSGSPSTAMYEECVAPLVDGLFQGYNATVLAYGQVLFCLNNGSKIDVLVII